ncbi:hypothetical protein ACH5RR_019421 [Cinchona calisaya]|uniref:Cation/H+ exchanger domain-containing protein n=1 Tax=Cinchona calisaya TaxID=153742 RepID=A0ABD2ZS54_9GENT
METVDLQRCEIGEKIINVHSNGGVWNDSAFLSHALPRLQLQLAVIFVLTQSLHLLLRRFHFPRICSEILAGIILGPTGLGNIPNFTQTLFPREGEIFIDILSKVGYIFFIFLSGVKMDPRMVLTGSAVTITAWTIGVLGPLIPFAGGSIVIILCKWFPRFKVHRYHLPAVRSIISTNVLFPFPVISSLLIDLKIMNSELGRLTLASTLISDLISNFMATIAANLKMGSGYRDGITASSVMLLVLWCFLIVGSAEPFAHWIIKQTPEGQPISRVYTVIISGAVLMAVILTDNAGINFLYGPFLLGLALPDGPPLGSTLVEKLETVASGLFTPLLVTYCSMKVNLTVLYDLEWVWRVWILIAVCLTMKFMSVLLPALVCKVPIKDALALSFIMCTQGVVQIAFYFTFSTAQIFDGETLTMVTLSVLLIAAVTQLSVNSLYDYSRIYTGASPLLIDHQLGQKASSGGSRSQKIIEVFHSFEQQYSGLVSVQLFTAISLPRFMHHDICSLAFDKFASFIILPFHKKWNQQGKLILDSSSLRIINCNVCDMAPCSVGILVNRHKIKRPSPFSSIYNVAVIFIGGADDREALAYAKRMARSPGMHLTVIRFVPWDPMGVHQWDAVLDSEILKDTRVQSTHQDNIVYKEERVKDGAETALQIHALAETFDLIMVGRRHREESAQLIGLNEWNELPELGPIGDMLAASEINRPVSVLVVQHQIVGQSTPKGELHAGEKEDGHHHCFLNESFHYPGIWTPEGVQDFLHHALPRLQFQLSAIFFVTQFLHVLLRPFKLQRVVSQILAGVILGPSCMGKFPKFSEIVFPAEGEMLIDMLSRVGYVFFMFLAGVQMDISTITKSGKKAWTIGLVSVVIPIIAVAGFNAAAYRLLYKYRVPAGKAIVGIQTLTPFAVVASLLIELKIVNSEIGRLALACTLISDLFSSLFTTWMRFAFADLDKSMSVKTSIISIIIVLTAILVLRPLFRWIIKQTPEGKAVDGGYIVLVSLTVLLSAVLSHYVGLQYQFGPFIVGLTVSSGPPLGSTLVKKLETLISGLFAPLIISTCGLKFDIFEVYDTGFLRMVRSIFFAFAVLKIISIILPAALICKMPIRDATVLSAIMSSQGIVELALCQNYLMNQVKFSRKKFC